MQRGLALKEEDSFTIPENAHRLTLEARLQIVDDYRAQNPLEEFPDEIQRIVDSFRTQREREVYRRHTEAFRLYYQALQDLTRAALAYREAVAYSEGFTLLQDSLKKTEHLVGAIVSEMLNARGLSVTLPKQLTERFPAAEARLQKLLEKAVLQALDAKGFEAQARLEFTKKLREAELVLGPSNEGTISERREDWLEAAENIRSRIYTVLKALREGMKITGYKPRKFGEQMQSILDSIQQRVTTAPVLPSLRERKGRRGGRAPKCELSVVRPARRIPIDEELFNTWMKAIEETREV